MSTSGPLRPVASRLARVLGAAALLLALGAAAATPAALRARSGHGDGMGDLGPLLLLMVSVLPIVLGTLLGLAGVLGGSPGVARAGAVVAGLGLLLVLPVAGFGRGSTTLVALLDLGAVVATAVAALLATRSTDPGTPDADPSSVRPS